MNDLPEAPRISLVRDGAKVLLIDDDAMVRTAVGAFLRAHGYTVVDAAAGEAGIELLRCHDDIGMAIIDMVMPKKTGTETMLELRQLRPGMPVLLITGYCPEMPTRHLQADNVTQLLMKPLEPDMLLRKVRVLLACAGEDRLSPPQIG